MPSFLMMSLIDDVPVMFNHLQPIDISLHISGGEQPNAFGLPKAQFEPFRSGSFVGSIEEGGPVRCDVVTVATHGNGTHTECVGHIAGKDYLITECFTEFADVARVVSVPLVIVDGDHVISRGMLEGAWQQADTTTLILRTLPNDANKRSQMWTGNNPPYIHVDAMKLIVERGIRHLMVDMPSVDREEDSGALVAHHCFWQWPHEPRINCTITEMIYVPNEVTDGIYLVIFNVAPFDGDAAPSRPMLLASH